MNSSQELRLHISTPLGVAYDELVSNAQIRVSDGYFGVNKNRLPTVQQITMAKIFIRPLNSNEIKTYLIGNGLMMIDKFECNAYVEFLIDLQQNIENNIYINTHENLVSKLKGIGGDYALNKEKENMLQKEIGKLKKIDK